MQENEIRALYCRTMGALHCPPGLTAPRRRRRRPAAALCAVGLAACGAVAAGGITLHNLQGDALITADHGFGVRIELPLTDPETLPDAVRQDAALMRPFDFENKEDQRRLILNDSINLGFSVPGASVHYSTGSNTGELREYGEALLPFDSWEDAGDYLGVMLPTPGIVADMHPLTSAIEPNDLESYYTARVRLAGDAASDTVEATEVAIEWLNAEGMLTMKAYQLYGEGENGRLSVQNLFKDSEIDAQTAAWHAEEYRMANGNTATIAVSEADAGDDRAWAFFAEGNCACTLEWNANDFAATQSPRAMLEAVLDSFP